MKTPSPSPTKRRKPSPDVLLRSQLHSLSQDLEEIGRQYVLRLQREIGEIADSIPLLKGTPAYIRAETKKIERISRLLQSVQINPPKGRRKDLKKIDLLIGEIEVITHRKE